MLLACIAVLMVLIDNRRACIWQKQAGARQVFNPKSDKLMFESVGRIEHGPARNIANIIHFILDEMGLDNREFQTSAQSVLRAFRHEIAASFGLSTWAEMDHEPTQAEPQPNGKKSKKAKPVLKKQDLRRLRIAPAHNFRKPGELKGLGVVSDFLAQVVCDITSRDVRVIVGAEMLKVDFDDLIKFGYTV